MGFLTVLEEKSHGAIYDWRLFLAVYILTIVIYGALVAIYRLYFHPLRHIPGPKLAAISRAPWCWHICRGTMYLWVHEAHQKYGDAVRMAPNEVSFSSGDSAWGDIYGTKAGKVTSTNKLSYDRDPTWSLAAANGGRSIASALGEDEHARHRKLVSHAFSDKALRDQEHILQGYVAQLMQQLAARSKPDSDAKGVVDLARWFIYFSFDVIGDLALGESFGGLERDELHPLVGTVISGSRGHSWTVSTGYYPFLKPLAGVLGFKGSVADRRAHPAYAMEMLSKRLKTETQRPDFVSFMMRHQGDDEKGLTMQELQINLLVFVVAGSETTATTLCGLVYYLQHHPDKLKTLQDEVRRFQSASELTVDQVTNLPYLNACISEVMRIYPPVAAGLPRLVPKGGDYISGHFIPGQTRVYVTQYASNHSANNFKDPEVFVPERWLEGNKEYAGDKRGARQPFSVGARNCVGKTLAYAELRLVLANLIWHFDMEIAPESSSWLAEQKYKVWLLWQKPPLKVKLTPVVR